MIPQQQLEKQDFTLEGEKVSFYTPETYDYISQDQLQFLIKQSQEVLNLFLRYFNKGSGFVFTSTDEEYSKMSEEEIKLEAQYAAFTSIFIESVPYKEGGYHTEVILYFWKQNQHYDEVQAEIYKEIIWSSDSFLV